jgi:hypothetical protein
MPPVKGYLGDSIYATWDQGTVTLYRSNDPRFDKPAITLTPKAYEELQAFVKRQARTHKDAGGLAPGAAPGTGPGGNLP